MTYPDQLCIYLVSYIHTGNMPDHPISRDRLRDLRQTDHKLNDVFLQSAGSKTSPDPTDIPHR